MRLPAEGGAKGIFKTDRGRRAFVRAEGVLFTKRFPPAPTLAEMKRWQDDQERILRRQAPASSRGTLRADVDFFIRQIGYVASRAGLASELHHRVDLYSDQRRSRLAHEDVRQAVSQWAEVGIAPNTVRNRVNAQRQMYHTLDAERSDPGTVTPTPVAPSGGLGVEKERP